MVRLQELLGQSVQQTLGLSDVLAQRERQGAQFGQALAATSAIQGQQRQREVAEEKSEKFSLFNTIGTVLGAVGGLALGPAVGLTGLAAASTGAGLGAGLGQAVSGEQRQAGQVTGGDVIQQGLTLGAGFEEKALGRRDKNLEGSLKLLDQTVKKQKTLRDQENVLRKEFNPTVKRFTDLQVQKNKVLAAAKRGTAAGDLASIFSFMKTLDPTSVVREGEQATAKNAKGIPETIRNAYNVFLTGVKLSPQQRKDFTSTTLSIFKAEEQAYKKISERFRTIAENQELDTTNIFGNLPTHFFNTVGEAEKADLPIGTVVFIGGRRAVID